jgi:uncharacterized Zn finger protein
MQRLQRKGLKVQPVRLAGRRIARTFWGEAWCGHLEKFSDYANRLPRGRSYVRNGSVCHLEIQPGRILAKVSGSEIYDVEIAIRPLPKDRWARLTTLCVGQVGSALELLQGRLSDRVMSIVTDRNQGLFPGPREMTLDCSCPDWAEMCKHVAAVLYGVGTRLDESPELLFRLRGVDHLDLVGRASIGAVIRKASSRGGRRLEEDKVGEVFGIDLAPLGAQVGRAATRTGTAGTRTPPQREATLGRTMASRPSASSSRLARRGKRTP